MYNTEFNKRYKEVVSYVLSNGYKQKCRNGNQLIVPFYSFTLQNPYEAELTLRKMYYDGIVGEFNTLIGKEPLTNVSQFKANGCNYWDNWAGKNGELNLDYYNKLHPALEDLIKEAKKNPTSRRLVIDLWDHDNVKNGNLSLPCCWYSMIFSIIDAQVHLTWIQRSVDVMIGLPSDVWLAYLFQTYIAHHLFLGQGSINFALSNVHIYEEHIEGAKEILTRTDADCDKPLKFVIKE